ncbi:hypothetical protein Tco_0081606, partial [Tanacetum coccineum]
MARRTVPLDHFPINALTAKVFFFMVKKGDQPNETESLSSPAHLPSPIASPKGTSGSPGNKDHPSSHSSFLDDTTSAGGEGERTLQGLFDLCLSLSKQSLDKECFHEEKIGREEIYEEKVDAEGV